MNKIRKTLVTLLLTTAAIARLDAQTLPTSGNPILPEFHADPEVLYSQQTGKFYIYSTTDGAPGWGGYYFTAFSSPDLVHWKHEGIILDLATTQVPWASGNAWAPCIEEKRQADGTFKYYFYYSGHDRDRDRKSIGVAVSDSPTGPFVDHGQPIVTDLPEGVGGGQQIDVDVFTDPVSGKSYLYWGNGYMAGAELDDDMTAVKPETVTVLTPEGGTLQDYAYREAPYVFFRNGTYYFLWSVDDTGSPNYHVAYGTSSSPLGPVQVAADPIVLIQSPEDEIYGTAHCSVLQLPDTDDWYIVYHRINKDYLFPEPQGPGYHRQVCIDRLEFNPDGTLRRVKPTNTGVKQVKINNQTDMGTIEDILKHNEAFVADKGYEIYQTSKYPKKKLAILTCMDTRLTELLHAALGLKNGDAKIIKNAGALIQGPYDSAMRSLLVAIYELGVQDVMVVAHTECGACHMSGSEMKHLMEERGIKKKTIEKLESEGADLDNWLEGFHDTEASVRQTVANIRENPLVPADVKVHGFIIDTTTGKLMPVD